MPAQVKVATLYQRPEYNRVSFKPDFCLYETNDWLVFPYELKGLSREEIAAHKPWVLPLLPEQKA